MSDMTNEEKILDILAGMSLRMDAMATKEEMQNEIRKVNIKLETEIIPRIDALAEGHATILEQLVPISRVDELENRVRMLEAVLSSVTSELQQLKKAQ